MNTLPHALAAPGFSDPVAAEAWDAWFRWRDGARVRDADVGATWQRVAHALAAAEPDDGARWAGAFADAMRRLRVLPDARILADAGTGRCGWPADDLAAVVNVAAFVRDPFTAGARVDLGGVLHGACLAVRMLDDALALVDPAPVARRRLRVGVVGLADALLMIGHPYDSAAARAQAQLVASTLATGCREASRRLARERGVPGGDGGGATLQLRHAQLTAIETQAELALLADNVADALAPLPAQARRHAIDSPRGERVLSSLGSTLARLGSRPADGSPTASSARAPEDARAALGRAMQPFIDAPIA